MTYPLDFPDRESLIILMSLILPQSLFLKNLQICCSSAFKCSRFTRIVQSSRSEISFCILACSRIFCASLSYLLFCSCSSRSRRSCSLLSEQRSSRLSRFRSWSRRYLSRLSRSRDLDLLSDLRLDRRCLSADRERLRYDLELVLRKSLSRLADCSSLLLSDCFSFCINSSRASTFKSIFFIF